MPEVGDLADWKRGADLAHRLEFADGEDYRIAAAEWRVENAARLLGLGDAAAAREEFGRAVRLWQPIRMRYLNYDRLRELA